MDTRRPGARAVAIAMATLREHVRLFELWARDNLLSRASFKDVLDRMRDQKREWRTTVHEAQKRIEARLQK